MVPYPAGSIRGPTTKTTKTLRKVHICYNLLERAFGALFIKLLIRFSEASALDTWVFERLEILFRNATLDSSLDLQLRQEKTVLFLHLLGLDVTGHSHRPHSRVSIFQHPFFHSHSIPRTYVASPGGLGIYGEHKSRR